MPPCKITVPGVDIPHVLPLASTVCLRIGGIGKVGGVVGPIPTVGRLIKTGGAVGAGGRGTFGRRPGGRGLINGMGAAVVGLTVGWLVGLGIVGKRRLS